ncbi:MAG: cache domain-containing protein [Phycisphaerae bacterium]|nr:cache domain-containing protein [Phycisphaerae bacterium]
MRHGQDIAPGGRIPLRCRIATTLIVLAVLGLHPPARAEKSPFDWAFVRLDYARREKAQQLRRFCDRIHALAEQARRDDVLIKFFQANRHYSELTRQTPATKELERKIAEFRGVLDPYYIENYLAFYDILFVDTQGRVFYTIRKESDILENLFQNTNSPTPLTRCLRENPQQETFIDFHYYGVSDEPAGFFIEPIHVDGTHLGWLVLQCALNKINSLFAGDEQMGQTGEAFVVNRDGCMLTESNFQGDSTILRKRLDGRNVQAKFAAGQGHLTVTDYRGFTALTSFEVFDFLNTKWLVVAKVDEAQIITEHFMRHRRYYADVLLRHLTNHPLQPGRKPFPKEKQRVLRVDIDEFLKAGHGELLKTLGVSTCTGLIATYPGKFGYLAHISPLDKAYGGNATDLMGSLLKKIKTYDIYKFERPRVRFMIIANHFKSMPAIIDRLVDEGFLLPQISVMYRPSARRADITYDYSKDRILVEWLLEGDSPKRHIQQADDAHNLGDVVRQAIRSEDEPKP